MSSGGSNNAGCGKVLGYLLLGGLGLWLGWRALAGLYFGLSYVGANVLLALDLSVYGRVGAGYWPGYVLLGLGLGAAGGMVAARRRFGLAWPVAAGGWLLLAALLGLVYATVFVARTEPAETARLVVPAGPPPAAPAPRPVAPVPVPAPADTSSVAAVGERLVVRTVALWPLLADTLLPPPRYLQPRDTVRLLRLAHGWARVAAARQPPGWLRLRGPAPLAELPTPAPAQEQAPAAPEASASDEPATPRGAAPADSTAPGADWPEGPQQYAGQVGEQPATFTLDWQPGGRLSGSYVYDQQPDRRYHLTGAGQANGELHLLEFARGRQTARGVLRAHAEGGYAGTMFTANGRQLSLRLQAQ